MPTPFLEMPNTLNNLSHEQRRPTASFIETALPGFKRTLEARRSIREYNGISIPETIMKECLHDATLTPSSSNLQTYQLYWVRDVVRKSEIANACMQQPAATTAGELVVVVARGDLWRSNLNKLIEIMTEYGTRPMPDELDNYYRKIVPLLMKTDAVGYYNFLRRVTFWFKGRHQAVVRTPISRADHRIYAHIQSSLAAQTLMLSIAAHGYESCPIGGMDSRRISRLLSLPRKAEITMVVAAGRGTKKGLYGPRIRFADSDLIKEV